MTREEAEAKVVLSVVVGERAATVMTLEALGVLKLDKPKTPDMQAGAIFNAYVSGEEAASILLEMHAAGLKIVAA